MNLPKEQESQIDAYLGKLRQALPQMPVAEREEIVREISVHIRECAEQNSDVDTILQRLGPAENLASQYGRELMIQSASRSLSPLLILRATFYLAMRGVEGLLLFLVALFGYTLGGGLVITAILKPILPREVGLWVGPHLFNFGLHSPAPSADREILGWWYIPVALFLGSFFLLLTTLAIRKFLKRSKQRGPLRERPHMGTQTKTAFCMLLVALLSAAVKNLVLV